MPKCTGQVEPRSLLRLVGEMMATWPVTAILARFLLGYESSAVQSRQNGDLAGSDLCRHDDLAGSDLFRLQVMCSAFQATNPHNLHAPPALAHDDLADPDITYEVTRQPNRITPF